MHTGNHTCVGIPVFNSYWMLECLILIKMTEILLFSELSADFITDNLIQKIMILIYRLRDLRSLTWLLVLTLSLLFTYARYCCLSNELYVLKVSVLVEV